MQTDRFLGMTHRLIQGFAPGKDGDRRTTNTVVFTVEVNVGLDALLSVGAFHGSSISDQSWKMNRLASSRMVSA